MKLQCKELQAETNRFTVGRAYSAEPRPDNYVKIVDDEGRGWLITLHSLKININGMIDDEAAYAIFRKSHA